MNIRPTRTAPPPTQHDQFGEVIDPVQHAPPAVRHQTGQIAPKPRADLPATGHAKLAHAIACVMGEIKPVQKSGWNDFHKYNYARMQDLSAELTPLMGKHGIVIFQNEVGRDLFDDNKVVAVQYEFTIAHQSGEVWPERPIMTGMSRARDSKGGFDDKCFNKCHTSARKYFLISLFQIPTDDLDDNDPGTGSGYRPQGQRPQAPRRAPAPDGKPVPPVPHAIEVVSGEPPDNWADRFIKAIESAVTVEDVNAWYDFNAKTFDKIQERGEAEFDAVYTRLVDAMDAREAAIRGDAPAPAKPPKTDPISSGPLPQSAPKPKAPHPPLTKAETEWLESLRNAFAGCEDKTQMAAAQSRYMMPEKAKYSGTVWNLGMDILNAELARLDTE